MVTAKVSFAGFLPDDRSDASLVLTIAAPRPVGCRGNYSLLG
jgi:hypothetical protein